MKTFLRDLKDLIADEDQPSDYVGFAIIIAICIAFFYMT